MLTNLTSVWLCLNSNGDSIGPDGNLPLKSSQKLNIEITKRRTGEILNNFTILIPFFVLFF